MPPVSLTEQQRLANASNRDNWRNAAAHRRQVSELIASFAADGGARLCVLGAGNLNDLSLEQLGAAFASIDLVDIDAQAMQRGLQTQRGLHSQPGLTQATIHPIAPRDVTGVWEQLEAVGRPNAPSEAIDRLIEAAIWPAPPVDETYQVVASTCLLSQLVQAVVTTLGEEHPRFPEVVFALRRGHVRQMSNLLEPAGVGVLITDFVSSDTAPHLPACAPEALPELLRRLIAQGNFFTGVNPFRLTELLGELAGELAIVPESIHCREPWLWNFGVRTYAVTAITFQKRGLIDSCATS